MRLVNLSRRPFLNRRPVARVAVLLWLIGGLLLALNVWLYADYLSGTTKNRERLAELGAEIDAAEEELHAAGVRLQKVDLGGRNERAAFLNELIDQRTFPWSRLFDDLEDSLHDDVYLSSVAPKVEEEEPSTRGRAQPSRMTPREARERARRQRRGEEQQMPTPETTNVEEADDVEVVELALLGTARSSEALLDFVDALYQDQRFDPFLSTEQRDERTGGVQFSITSYYLLPRRTPAPTVLAGLDAAAEEPGRDEAAVAMASKSREVADRTSAGVPEPARPRGSSRPSVPVSAPTGVRGAAEAALPDGATPSGNGPSGDTTPGGTRLQTGSSESPTGSDASDPSLTQPAASSSPALRRVGSLSPLGVSGEAKGNFEETRI